MENNPNDTFLLELEIGELILLADLVNYMDERAEALKEHHEDVTGEWHNGEIPFEGKLREKINNLNPNGEPDDVLETLLKIKDGLQIRD